MDNREKFFLHHFAKVAAALKDRCPGLMGIVEIDGGEGEKLCYSEANGIYLSTKKLEDLNADQLLVLLKLSLQDLLKEVASQYLEQDQVKKMVKEAIVGLPEPE